MVKLVNWLVAREALKQGKAVRRQTWNHTKLVEYIPNGEDHFENVMVDWCGKKGTWVPCVADFFYDDWIIEA